MLLCIYSRLMWYLSVLPSILLLRLPLHVKISSSSFSFTYVKTRPQATHCLVMKITLHESFKALLSLVSCTVTVAALSLIHAWWGHALDSCLSIKDAWTCAYTWAVESWRTERRRSEVITRLTRWTCTFESCQASECKHLVVTCFQLCATGRSGKLTKLKFYSNTVFCFYFYFIMFFLLHTCFCMAAKWKTSEELLKYIKLLNSGLQVQLKRWVD